VVGAGSALTTRMALLALKRSAPPRWTAAWSKAELKDRKLQVDFIGMRTGLRAIERELEQLGERV
jgi:hypothetical protein